jgi:hypothetical protein
MNKKNPIEGDKTPTRGEKNLHFSKLPKKEVSEWERRTF